jgi:hypothetical protein
MQKLTRPATCRSALPPGRVRAALRLGIALSVLVVAAGLAACSSGAADVGSAAPAEPATATSTTAAAPTALPAAGELESRCADALDDGTGHDLATVELVRSGDVLVVAFALTTPPVSGASFLTLELHDATGTAVRQLGIELDGADPVAAYIATSPSDPVQRLDGTVHVVDAAVHGAFPATVLDDLGTPWSWLASVGTESTLEDICADSGTGTAPVPVVVG